jgi:hypothetical protein
MSAGKYSFVLEQGSTFDIEIQYKDTTGSAVDLSGYSGKMQIRPTIASETVYLTLSSSLNGDGTGLNFSGSNGSISSHFRKCRNIYFCYKFFCFRFY